jgi:hypothetical protein
MRGRQRIGRLLTTSEVRMWLMISRDQDRVSGRLHELHRQ